MRGERGGEAATCGEGAGGDCGLKGGDEDADGALSGAATGRKVKTAGEMDEGPPSTDSVTLAASPAGQGGV